MAMRPSAHPISHGGEDAEAADAPDAADEMDPSRPRLHGRRCPACGFDLRTADVTGAEQCTECGQSLDAAALDAAEERRLFRKVLRIVIVVSVGLFTISLLVNYVLAGRGKSGADAMVYIAPALVFLIGPIAPVLLALFAARHINRRHGAGEGGPDLS